MNADDEFRVHIAVKVPPHILDSTPATPARPGPHGLQHSVPRRCLCRLAAHRQHPAQRARQAADDACARPAQASDTLAPGCRCTRRTAPPTTARRRRAAWASRTRGRPATSTPCCRRCSTSTPSARCRPPACPGTPPCLHLESLPSRVCSVARCTVQMLWQSRRQSSVPGRSTRDASARQGRMRLSVSRKLQVKLQASPGSGVQPGGWQGAGEARRHPPLASEGAGSDPRARAWPAPAAVAAVRGHAVCVQAVLLLARGCGPVACRVPVCLQ